MPYRSNADSAPRIRSHLPEAAQDIYREAFNHAWDSYAGNPRREEIAHRVAWAAVKKQYVKSGDRWTKRDTGDVG